MSYLNFLEVRLSAALCDEVCQEKNVRGNGTHLGLRGREQIKNVSVPEVSIPSHTFHVFYDRVRSVPPKGQNLHLRLGTNPDTPPPALLPLPVSPGALSILRELQKQAGQTVTRQTSSSPASLRERRLREGRVCVLARSRRSASLCQGTSRFPEQRTEVKLC